MNEIEFLLQINKELEELLIEAKELLNENKKIKISDK